MEPPEINTTGQWTIDSAREYARALREADARFYEERDRRYTEVAAEREKALKIKEEADKVALDLARQIQQYKDEQANELREQINSERGIYVTKGELGSAIEKIDVVIKPLTEYVHGSQGGHETSQQHWGLFIGVASLMLVAIGIVVSTVLVIHFAK